MTSKAAQLWHLCVNVFRSFRARNGMETAKSLTYTSLFAVVPLITLILAILSAFPSFQVFGGQVQHMLFDRLLPSSTQQLQGYLADFSRQARKLTWVGAVMLMGTAYLMLVNIERHFNRIWGVDKARQGLTGFLLYWCVLSLGPLLLGLGFAISSYLTSLSLFREFSAVTDDWGANSVLLQLFPVLLTVGAFTLLYAAVPNCKVRLRHALVGAVVVSMVLLVAKWLFTQTITTASYKLVYGTFAALPVFLLWLYVCWVVILFGANLVQALPQWQYRSQTVVVHPTLLLLALLHLFWQRQQRGATVQVEDLLKSGWSFPGTPIEVLLRFLQEHRFINKVAQDEYALVRDLHGVTMWQLLRTCPWAQPALDELQQPLPALLERHLPLMEELCERFAVVEQVARDELQATLGADFARFRQEALS